MPPHPRHHGPHGGPPHGPPEWYVNDEKERELREIGERLQRIGQALAERGLVKLNEYIVKPPGRCLFILRYERMHRSDLSLKLELLWEDTGEAEGAEPGDDVRIE